MFVVVVGGGGVYVACQGSIRLLMRAVDVRCRENTI